MRRKHLEKGMVGMDRVRELLRLWERGYNQREISRTIRISRSCVQQYLSAAKASGLSWEACQKLNDEQMREALNRKDGGCKRKLGDPDYKKIGEELVSRKGVTLELLWQEWLATEDNGYSYSTFCRRYREWEKSKDVVMRQEYSAGEFVLCDYAGETLSYSDESQGERKVQIFVAVLGASNYIYAEATPTQQTIHWLGSNVRALEYFGGIPKAIVIDNLKSGVTKSCRYEPEIARAYQDFAAHYDLAILPARARKPRDKGKVEKAVQEVERRLLAPLRNQRFSCIGEINAALRPLLANLNNREMQDYGESRKALFDKLDKPALKPLPTHKFVASSWKRVRVNRDYHIEVDRHYYSVPFHLVNEEVWVKIGEKLVEVQFGNERVACHLRCAEPNRLSTIAAHLAPQHVAMKNRSAESCLVWAEGIGMQTRTIVQMVLDSVKHQEQAYRLVSGLQKLEKKYGNIRLEQAAGVAVVRRMPSYRYIRAILENEGGCGEKAEVAIITHSNIRGEGYYH